MVIELTDKEKLDLINKEITNLVDCYDRNNIMDTIPDYAWSYILNIEKLSKKVASSD